jgi:Protein of unknown function (DUF3175)
MGRSPEFFRNRRWNLSPFRNPYDPWTLAESNPSLIQNSDALDLERKVFAQKTPGQIARSLKRSAQRSDRRKLAPFRSAMSMLAFYINRAGTCPRAGCASWSLPRTSYARRFRAIDIEKSFKAAGKKVQQSWFQEPNHSWSQVQPKWSSCILCSRFGLPHGLSLP